ncbi:hypothetical protein BBJ29_006525 [Phytophthora kernoviae]|uniref:FYVE-type domain-containing protein n=1 Tax=Phytophthora kernoviae TaxID=325452 RepID=A0A3F2RG07_9STRA|nr:hypothetical protein BBP00_00008231 [Phytophthora kernoviae]RLN68479.1 hypothetical protein BBJ29_006525 [Phytophthora kernoviae]
MWASSSMISESGCSESSRELRFERDTNKRRLTITRGPNDLNASWNVELSDQEIVSDLLATLPKLKAGVEDLEEKAEHWHRKSKSGDSVEVFELVPSRDGRGDDMDLVHAVMATIEIECHLNEVLNVLTSHKTSHDLEASMRAIIPKKKVRQGEVLLQPHCTTLDGAPLRRTRSKKPARSAKMVRSVHDQLAPIEEKHQSRSVLGSGLRGLDHISVGFDIQTRNVHCIGARGAAQSTRIVAHGYASVTGPERFGNQQMKSKTSYSPAELAQYRSTHVNAEAKHVIELLTTSLQRFERVIRRRRLGLQTFMHLKPQVREGGDRQGLQACTICEKRFSLIRRELFCQLCGHVCCAECSKLYEVEAHVGEVTKNRLCVRCIANVDSCIFEDEDFMTALGPAVVPEAEDDDGDDTDYEYDSQYDSHSGSQYDSHKLPSIDSATTCSESDTVGSPDEMSMSQLAQDNVLERSMALQNLDRLVNSEIRNPMKQSRINKLRDDVEDHLKRTLRNTLRDTKREFGGDESSFSIAPPQRDYQLEFDGSMTMSPSNPVPPKPLPMQERRRIEHIVRSGALSPVYDRSALNMLAQIAAAHLNCPIGYVTMTDDSTQYVVGLHPRGAIGMSIPREESMCSYTIYHDKPLVVKNALNDVRFSHMGFVSQTGLRFYAGFPIRAPDSAVVATICAADYVPHKYISAKQYAEMEALADLASTLIITPSAENKNSKQAPNGFPRW